MIENRTIFTRDNLDILPGMDSESVDLIYLDPPFNSNRHYEAPVGSKAAGAAFKDAWTFEDTDDAWWGLIAEKHPALYKVIDAAGAVGNSGDKSYLIYMAMRVLELHRILKLTGSIYLHCDSTMSHSLKMMMDSIFGRRNFRNDIIWKRTNNPKGSQFKSKKYGVYTDNIFFYSKSDSFYFNLSAAKKKLDSEEIKKKYKLVDEHGRYYQGPIVRGASMGDRPNLCYEYKGYTSPPSGWRMTKEKLIALDKAGNLGWSKNKMPFRKLRPQDDDGHPLGGLWDDISRISSQSPERTGYPTQKPIALLERIIKVSSNEGDVVFDPFCGCATTLIAAEKEKRQWIGIDISSKAVDLVKDRLHQTFQIGEGSEGELAYKSADIIHRTDIPIRSDHATPRSKDIKHILFGKQKGICNGCKHDFPFQNFTLDHIQPTSRGGADTDANLQLLCNHCNSVKSNGTMAELIARLRERGILH